MRFIFFMLFLFLPTGVFAQGPPITVDTPIMLGLSGSGVRTFGKFVSKEKSKVYIQPIVLPYNILPKVQVGVQLPLKAVFPDDNEAVFGLSNVLLFGKFELFKIDGKAETFRVLGVLKQSFPTATHVALGEDIFRTYTGLVIGRVTSRLGLYSNVGYTFTNKNGVGSIRYDLSLGVPLLSQQYPPHQLNLFLESSGDYNIEPGRHSISLSPGIQYIPGRRILFESSVQIPILQKRALNPTRFSILFGTRFLFN